MKRFFKNFAFIVSLSLYGSSLSMSSNVQGMRWEEIGPEQKEVAFYAGGLKSKVKGWISAARSGVSSPCAAEDLKEPTNFPQFLSGIRGDFSGIIQRAQFSPEEYARISSAQVSRLDSIMERYRLEVLSAWQNQTIQAAFSGLRGLFSTSFCPMDDYSDQYHKFTEALRPLAEAYERFNEFLEQHSSAGGRDVWGIRREIFPNLIVPGKESKVVSTEVKADYERLNRNLLEIVKTVRNPEESIMVVAAKAQSFMVGFDSLLPKLLRHHGIIRPGTPLTTDVALEWVGDLQNRHVIDLPLTIRDRLRGGFLTIDRHSYPSESLDGRIPRQEYLNGITIWKAISDRFGDSHPEVRSMLTRIFTYVGEQDGMCAGGAMGRTCLTLLHAADFLVNTPPK